MQSITLQTSDSVISSGDVLGRLGFAASSELDGSDAILVAATIKAIAESDFDANNNATSLVFSTASSSVASDKLKITSDGDLIPFSGVNPDIGSVTYPFRYVNTDVVSFNINDESTLTKGQLSWDDTEGSLDIGLTDNTTIHIGEHRYFRIRNETGATLYKGQVVYATGVHSNGLITPDKYLADGSIREVRFMGVILEDVNHQNNGYVVDFGHLHDMDLDGSASNYAVGDETWVAGDILYVHPTVAGKLTKVEPKHSISVAIVLDPGNGNGNGRMFVRPTSYGHLDDNHDVAISGATNGQFLQYNSATDYWVPSSSGNFTTLQVNGTPVPTGVGTNNYLTRWTGANSIGNSVIYDDGGNEVLITGILDFELDAQTIEIGKNGLSVDISSPIIRTSGSLTHNGSFTHNGSLTQQYGNVIFNENGDDYDFRVEGGTDQNLLVVNAGTNSVGIGSAGPNGKLGIGDSKTNTSNTYTLHSTSNHYSTTSSTYYAYGIYNILDKYVNSGVYDTGFGMASDLVSRLNGNGTLSATYGLRTYAGIGTSSSAGTNTTAYGVQSRVINNGTSTSLIGEARGIDIYINGDLANNKTNVGITTAKALNIQTILDATNKWGIYQEGVNDDNYFAGNVGIGAPSPSQKLDVVGQIKTTNTNNNKFTVNSNSIIAKVQAYDVASTNTVYIGAESNSNLNFVTNNQNRINISNAGSIVFNEGGSADANVRFEGDSDQNLLYISSLFNSIGIGVVQPINEKLRVEGGNFTFNANNGSYTFKVGSTASDNLLYVDGTSNDKVGIGTGSPSYKLDVNGTFSANSVNVNNQFTFPTTDGAADQVLVTNGSGTVTWQNQSGTSATTDSHYAMIHVFG